MNPAPLRVWVIRRSMRCFIFGLCSLLPFIGLALSVLVLAMNWQIRSRARDVWNPARGYLQAGCLLATLGAGISFLGAITIGYMAALPGH
ncbi:MAG TPA: hypothetical protein VHB20_16265 [Verrucomicrobiae bacterium]|jgi:hypothetical protein|nr:hypothetical protein [Verrucomicrobiae bacterium]